MYGCISFCTRVGANRLCVYVCACVCKPTCRNVCSSICECSHTYFQLVGSLVLLCSSFWSLPQPPGSALVGVGESLASTWGGDEDSEPSRRPRPTQVPENQHPPTPASRPRTCPAPNSQGPQGDLWPPARTVRKLHGLSLNTAPPVATNREP